jgi:hypothetical protein
VQLDQLGLVGPVQRLGHGVVIRIADCADRRRDARLAQAVGVAETGVLAAGIAAKRNSV